MFTNVRIRLTLLAVFIVLCIYSVASATVYSIVRNTVELSTNQHLSEVAVRLSHHPNTATEVERQGYFLWLNTSYVSLSNAPSDIQQQFRRFQHANVSSAEPQFTNVRTPDTTLRLVYVPLGYDPQLKTQGFVMLAGPLDQEFGFLGRLKSTMVWVGFCGIIAAALGGFYLGGRTLRPIHRSWQRQTEFVADASHELRTPLAVIQSNLGVVLEHPEESIANNLEWLNNAQSEVRRLSRLIEDLLTLARSDSGTTVLHKSTFNLAAMIEEVVELFQPIAWSKDIHFTVGDSNPCMIEADVDRIKQLLVILIDNAIKYTDEQGTVRVSCILKRTGVMIEVSDSGIGIREEDISRVFDRFYRADSARTHLTSHGVGLGLSLAKWITTAHGGRISISSRESEGTTVTVMLPID